MPLDARDSRMPESFYALDNDVTEKTGCGDPANSTAGIPSRPSPWRCETALRVLSRDSQLRLVYVRRRWQGLLGSASTDGRF
jgi:hypothetical protein